MEKIVHYYYDDALDSARCYVPMWPYKWCAPQSSPVFFILLLNRFPRFFDLPCADSSHLPGRATYPQRQ